MHIYQYTQSYFEYLICAQHHAKNVIHILTLKP